jgi:hypothetical protein
MAIGASPRLGITRWSADTDAVSRAQFDGDHGRLDDLVAMAIQGLAADRPAAAIQRRLYYATDTGVLSLDTGTAWVEVLTEPRASTAYVAKAIVDAKGDLIAATGIDAVARVAVGADGQVLTADAASAAGVKWAAAASAGLVGCLAKSTASTSFANGTPTVVPLEAEEWDTHGFHDTVTNNSRLTVPAGRAGKYRAAGWAFWSAHSTGTRIGYIYKNGIQAMRVSIPPDVSTNPTAVIAYKDLSLIAGDFVELAVYQISGGALTLTTVGTGESAWLSLTRIGD